MKEIKTTEATGHILCHDLTQIIKGVTKDARFRKGHIITPEDIPVLLSMGKEHLFVWENNENMLHEDEAAEILRRICQGQGMTASAPKEGKIELTAEYDGVLKIDLDRLNELNEQDDIAIATLPQYMPVKAGMKLAGMRVIPLVIAKDKMHHACQTAGNVPLLNLYPYRSLKIGVITTGSEVFNGLIKDTFTPVVAAKLQKYGLQINEHRLSDDDPQHTLEHIRKLLQLNMDMIICTGGMSVDPDDKTPAAIKAAGADIITYGAPVLPGAMCLLSYYQTSDKTIPILGLPGCVMYAATTIFDILLPRLIAGIPISRRDIRHLGAGGLCLNCEVCHYPNCSFGK